MKKLSNTLLSLNEMAANGYRFAVIAIDETEHWRKDIAMKAGKIEGIYLVNLTEPTHCCEISVSFWAHHLRYFITNVESFTDDEIADLERKESESDCYLSGSNRYYPKKLYRSGSLADLLERESANPTVC